MKFGPLDLPSLPALALPRLPLAAFRRRLVFHGAFLLLALATVALAVTLLTDERQRSRERYEASFRQRLSTLTAQLRHPTGQLALINANSPLVAEGGLTPVVLPFSAIDFDDPFKARQAVEMSGCALRWDNGDQICAAVGNRAYGGAVIYLVADLVLPPALPRARGQTELLTVSRARVSLSVDGQTTEWVAPFEAGRGAPVDEAGGGLRGRLTGFAGEGTTLNRLARPERDFRAWLWQDGRCADESQDALPACPRRSLVSIRLPVQAWRALVQDRANAIWPPQNLQQTQVRLRWMPEGDEVAFDSANVGAIKPFTLGELSSGLAPGEHLHIERLRRGETLPVTDIAGQDEAMGAAPPWLSRLILRLPLSDQDAQRTTLEAQDTVVTPSGRYQLRLTGDLSSVDRSLGVTATRMSWYAGAMLAAIALTWLFIEVGLMRRITSLTRRAAALRYNMQDPQVDRRLGELDVSDLGGKDELGILANTLATLLERVKEGVRREHIRAEQERDMWHAVGHEIMSPLQSLMVLHENPDDPSHRYVQRMQQAVRVLYGTASPSEAISAAPLELQPLNLTAFLQLVAQHAPDAGIADVRCEGLSMPIWVMADEHSLEDVLAHVLRNADRYRPAHTPITITLQSDGRMATVAIHNQGPAIPEDQLDRIFEYGVSDQNTATLNGERRGQGLYVVRTYLAKMAGTVRAFNRPDGVCFEMTLPVSSSPA